MMTQRMRFQAATNALIYPFVWVFALLLAVWVRGELHGVVWWHWVLAWVVIYLKEFYSERRKLLKKAERVK